jgi:hypothetical protein
MMGSRPIGYILRCVAALLLSAWTARAEAVDGFLSNVEDLPLMSGLIEDKAAGLAFDAAGGRIVEAYAYGAVSERQVLDFYGETLPQLGWTTESQTQFYRNGERLRLEFAQSDRGLTVHYLLSPH